MKLKEIRSMSSADLREHVDTYKRQLFAIRYKIVAGSTEEANKIRDIRKTIARILTVLKERSMEDKGVK